jgi:phosphate uptake regulator
VSGERREEELAREIRDEDDAAQRGQTRDAARIRREMAETDRIEHAIDALLDDSSETGTTTD